MTEVGCWAHTRRKFVEALETAPEPCSMALALIGQLYRVERTCQEREMDTEAVRSERQQHSVPLLDKLFDKLKAQQAEALPKSPLGKAIGYALNQEDALRVYVTDGRLNIDNNPAENALRPLALGRKNWLFAGSERGGKACAIALSLLLSAKACGLNPTRYLEDVLRRYRGHQVSKLDQLLPANWTPLPRV